MTQLAGSTVLVTGANRGIGAELVRQLLDRDVASIYAAARDPQRITIDDARVVPIPLDVTDAGSIERAAATAIHVDIVVNNARIASSPSVLDPDTWTLRRELETNLFGPLAVTRAPVIVRQILDGIERGASEVLADEVTRAVRAGLPEPIDIQFARFASHAE